MKKILLSLFFIAITVSIFGQNESNLCDKLNNKVIVDTSKILIQTDSLAEVLLEKYDEASLRRTGTPIAVEHYDKSISSISGQNKIIVTYRFNKIKFYGPTGSDIIINDSDKYPYLFEIILDKKTNKI